VRGGVLVTGGAGFVGSHLTELLLAAGERVVVLDDLSRGRRAWLHTKAELHEVDVRDGAGVQRVVEQVVPEAVVHLAAMHFIPDVDGAPRLAEEVNVAGTRNLVEALARVPPRVFVFASTAAVYPDRRSPIDETCPPGPLDVYGQTKLEGEALVSAFAAESGARCVIARIFNVIGRRETNPHVVPELVGQLRRGEVPVRLGNLEPRRDYTDVRDVTAALHGLLVARLEASAVFNVGSGRSTSVADLVAICEDVLGRSIEVESLPSRRRAQDRLELVADATRLREATGWQPKRSLHETLAELLGDD
jgi:UDP-glucose 4-epimerase